MVTSQKMIERARKKARLQKHDKFRGFKATGLMIDERIDDNKEEIIVGEKGRKKFQIVRKENCAVIGYPGEEFLGHLAPTGGRAVDLANSVMSFIQEREIDISNLQVIFADGCNKMAGFNHGFIAEFERLLGRPLLHVHCLVHSLEKVFGHLFIIYAGPTSGPASWSGEEAKKLTGKVWEKDVADFEAVSSPTLRLVFLFPGFGFFC